MEKRLEVPALAPLVPHKDFSLERICGERDAVDKSEVERPGLARIDGEVVGAETKVDRDRRRGALVLAKELPLRGASETVLGEGRGRVRSGRRGTEDGEDDGNTTTDCGSLSSAVPSSGGGDRGVRISLAAIEMRLLAQPELLIALAVLPADDRSSVEQNLRGLTGGEGKLL